MVQRQASVHCPKSSVRRPSSIMQLLRSISSVHRPSFHWPSSSSRPVSIVRPASIVQYPESTVHRPSSSVQRPSSRFQSPSSIFLRPVFIGHRPAFGQRPSSNIQSPSSNIQSPPSIVYHPASSVQFPKSIVYFHASSFYWPSSSIKRPEQKLHRKKRFTSFPSPAGMSLTKLPLGRNNSVMTSLFPPRESLVVTSWLGTGNSRSFFFTVYQDFF